VMSERNRQKRGQRSLSASKTRPDVGKTGSIVSFFNNAPPARLACPICGQMVARFWMNEHIDSQCEQSRMEAGGDGVGRGAGERVSAGATASPPPRTPEKSPSPDVDSSPSQAEASPGPKKEKKQTSPYFKNQGPSAEVREACSEARVVRTIHLGCLASKLSRRQQRQGKDSQLGLTQPFPLSPKPSGSVTQALGDSGALNRSQTENHYIEPSRTVLGSSTGEANSTGLGVPETSPGERHERPGVLTEVWKGEGPNQTDVSDVSSSAAPLSPRSTVAPRATLGSPADSSCKKRRHHGDRNPTDEVSGLSGSQQANQDRGTSSERVAGEAGDAELVDRRGRMSGAAPSSVTVVGGSNGELLPESTRLPYYLRNFLAVLEAVLENEDDRQLFNQEDMRIIRAFQHLSEAGQKLYVRLFQRKLQWLKINKLDYSEIGSDLSPAIQELVKSGFLQTESELQDLSEVLDLLLAPELKALAKTFHLAGPGTHKQQLAEGLLRLSRQRTPFALGHRQPGISAVILRRAKELLGACVRVRRVPRAVFSRLLLLFSIADSPEEEEAGSGGQGQLYTVLMVNMGRLVFPSYAVQRKARVFRDRDDLIRYETAMHSLSDVMSAMQNGNWEEARQLYLAAKCAWRELRDSSDMRHHEELPVFLRCFSVGWAYTRILSRGVEVLQRLRLYEVGHERTLSPFLTLTVYCPDSRGRWWDRLALNLQQHLKQPQQAIRSIKEGLADPLVRTGHRLSLYQRAVRMRESPSCRKFRHLLRDVPEIVVNDVTHVTIRGQMCPQAGMGKSVFLMQEEETRPGPARGAPSAMVMCSVEELALAHYRQQGFDQGIHGEGSTFSTLCGLLLWDILYMDGIADVFRNPYQSCPLDLHTDCFYENRKEAIETRAQLLQEASTETLKSLLAETWHSQEGRASALVSWDRFPSLQQAQSLVACLGGRFLSGLVRRMARDYRHCRGGLPDLVVWNTQDSTYKLVEVKGPNDRLSHKQMIWLDELRKLGADVEVCHVTDIGARSTRLS
uniref:Fanconi-associated nuclease n=1 Tax=Lepisosteus oculatus TaxID=7918 RepID=W5N8A0_LEPOC